MSFLDFFIGKKQSADSTALVINDQFLEVIQLKKDGNAVQLVGFNRVELPAGVVEKGVIVRGSDFQKTLTELVQQAKPQLVSIQKLSISVPFNQLFAFIKKGTSRNDPEVSQKMLMDEIRKESPVSPEEMNFHFYSDPEGQRIAYGAIGWLKSWESALRETLSSLGAESIEFVPEPLAQWALAESKAEANFVVVSWEGMTVYLSFFFRHLLYDTFSLDFSDKKPEEALEIYQKQYQQERISYRDTWGVDPKIVYLVNCPEAQKPIAEELAKTHAIPHLFLEERHTPLSVLLPDQNYSATLMGLALLALKE